MLPVLTSLRRACQSPQLNVRFGFVYMGQIPKLQGWVTISSLSLMAAFMFTPSSTSKQMCNIVNWKKSEAEVLILALPKHCNQGSLHHHSVALGAFFKAQLSPPGPLI